MDDTIVPPKAKSSWSPPDGWLQYEPSLLHVSKWGHGPNGKSQSTHHYVLPQGWFQSLQIVLTTLMNKQLNSFFSLVWFYFVIWCFKKGVRCRDWQLRFNQSSNQTLFVCIIIIIHQTNQMQPKELYRWLTKYRISNVNEKTRIYANQNNR